MPTPQPAELSYANLGGQPIISAVSAMMAFDENGWDDSAWAGKANSYHCPVGEEVGTGWVLMFRNRLNELSTSAPLTLTFGQGGSDESIEIHGLYIRSAQRVSPGQSQSNDAVYLVELVDTRYQLNRKSINKRYNCRPLRDTSDTYVTATKNSGTPWTWPQVITDLWNANDTLIGSIGTLPDLTDVTSTPENLRYEGTSAWAALNDVCRRCGCQVILDNAFVNNFYVVRLGVISGDDDPSMFGDGGTDVTKTGVEATISSGPTTRPAGGGDGLVTDEEILQGDAILPRYVTVWFPTEYGASQISDELTGFGKWFPIKLDGTDDVDDMPGGVACEFHDSTGDSNRIPRPTFNTAEAMRYELMTARFLTAASSTPTNDTELRDRAREIAYDLYRTLHDLSYAHLRFMGIRFGDDANVVIPGKCISSVTWGDFGGGFTTDLWRQRPYLLPESPPAAFQPGGGSGGACNTVRFRIGAIISGTMSAICFIHAVDAGFTVDDVPDLANLEFPGNPYPGTPNIIVCDPLCMFFNEPAEGLTDRLGWAKYMMPLVPNTCQPDVSYLAPQWEVFQLNCVNNPSC